MSLDQDITKFLRKHQDKARKVAKDLQAAKELVVYGESHVGYAEKAAFFAQVMRTALVRYHASEHFLNTRSYGRAVAGYLKGRHGRSGLHASVRALTPILDFIKGDLNKRGLVFAGSPKNTGRDRRIYGNFMASRELHLKAGRFSASDRGMFHIGAAHGSRLPQDGSAKTTTQLLIAKGLDVATVRLMVDKPGSSSVSGGAITISSFEVSRFEPVSGGATLDLLPILRRVAGGNAFGVDVTISGSPFHKIKPKGVKSSKSFADYWDRLIFLP